MSLGVLLAVITLTTMTIALLGVARARKDRRGLKSYQDPPLTRQALEAKRKTEPKTVAVIAGIEEIALACDQEHANMSTHDSVKAVAAAGEQHSWLQASLAITLQFLRSVLNGLYQMTGAPLLLSSTADNAVNVATDSKNAKHAYDDLPVLERVGDEDGEAYLNDEEEEYFDDDSFDDDSFLDDDSDEFEFTSDEEYEEAEYDDEIDIIDLPETEEAEANQPATALAIGLCGLDFYRIVAKVAAQNVQFVLNRAMEQTEKTMEKKRIEASIQAIQSSYPDFTCLSTPEPAMPVRRRSTVKGPKLAISLEDCESAIDSDDMLPRASPVLRSVVSPSAASASAFMETQAA